MLVNIKCAGKCVTYAQPISLWPVLTSPLGFDITSFAMFVIYLDVYLHRCIKQIIILFQGNKDLLSIDRPKDTLLSLHRDIIYAIIFFLRH